jgi:hypothetical protein
LLAFAAGRQAALSITALRHEAALSGPEEEMQGTVRVNLSRTSTQVTATLRIVPQNNDFSAVTSVVAGGSCDVALVSV